MVERQYVDGDLHGFRRLISADGSYCTGYHKDNNWYGEWIYYTASGKVSHRVVYDSDGNKK